MSIEPARLNTFITKFMIISLINQDGIIKKKENPGWDSLHLHIDPGQAISIDQALILEQGARIDNILIQSRGFVW